MKGLVQSIEVSYILHATEDPQTLTKAISSLLSVDAVPEEERMEGHFGNAIAKVRYHFIGEDAAAALSSIAAHLPALTKDRLKCDISELMDEHSALYLRFDKQRLVEGTLKAGTADPVRIRVKPRVFLLRGGAKEFYSKILFGGS
ncbi:MAG: RNA-binding domain-containing protein [Nitrososphaerales archaeon]